MASRTKNIGGTEKDIFYRYKRPELKTKVEKPGTNGVKTVIENMSAIAKALRVPPEYPTRFLGYELCTQATFEDSTDRTCTVVKGKHTDKDLDKALDEFIKKFILCPRCKLPETKISVKKGQVRVHCAGCGHAGPLTTGHRLENYIVKNPPKGTKLTVGEDKKGEKEDKESDLTPPRETVNVAKEEKDKEEAWSLDTSEAAQKARLAEFLVSTPGKKSSGSDDDVKGSKAELILKNFMKSTNDPISIAAEVDRLHLKNGFTPEEKYRILLIAAIDTSNPKSLGTQFKKQASLFKRLVNGLSAGVLFITSIERLLDSASPSTATSSEKEKDSQGKDKTQDGDLKTNLVNRIGLILQALYEHDVLSEEVILTWAQSPPDSSAWAVGRDVAAHARKCAKPFIDWLQSAEEE